MTCKQQFIFYILIIVHPLLGAQSLSKADELAFSGQYRQAINEYSALLLSNNSLTQVDYGNCFLRKGLCLFNLQKIDSAISDYFVALKTFEQIKNNDRIAAACNNLGDAYYKKGDINLAEKYFNQAHELYIGLNDTLQIIKCINNQAVIASDKNDIQGAINLHKKTFAAYPDKLYLPIFANHFQNLANCYIKTNVDSAIYYNTKALNNATANGDSLLIAKFLNNIGELYLSNGNYIKARLYFLQSEEAFKQYPDTIPQAILFYNLSRIYDSLGDYKKAYHYANLERVYSESITNSDKRKITAELSEKYESDKKDAEIVSQQKENKLKSRSLLLSLVALGLVGFLGVFSFINYRKKQKANQQLHRQNEYILSLNKKLDQSNQVKTKLFSIISHDLRSPISSLFAYLQLQQHIGKNPATETTVAVTRQTENLLETLEDLLMWSKSQLEQFTPEYSNFNLYQSVTEAQQLCAVDSKVKKLVFTNEIPQNTPIFTDVNMLTIVMRNIMANAVQNAIPETTVLIKYENTDTSHAVIIQNATAQPENELMLTLNSEMINSKKHGLGRILIQEFTEKLHGTITYSVESNLVITKLKLPL